MGLISQIIFGLLKIFCGDQNQKPHGGQQHGGQHHGGQYNGHQQGGWNQGGYPQQQQYPPQGWNQNQQPQHGGWTGGSVGSEHDYTQLRNQARHEGDLAHKCFADSQAAYKSGNGARAKELSNQGKAHQAKQDQLDEQAAAWIFQGEWIGSTGNSPWCEGFFRFGLMVAVAKTSGMVARIVIGRAATALGWPDHCSRSPHARLSSTRTCLGRAGRGLVGQRLGCVAPVLL